MPIAVVTPKDRLREIAERSTVLIQKGIRSAEENAELGTLLTEGKALKEQIEQNRSADELTDWARGSAGALPLAGASSDAAQFRGFAPAGQTLVEAREQQHGSRVEGGIRILDQYGEGLFADKALEATRATGYREAFARYIRVGERGLRSSELRVLQDGSDTQGGFLVPEDVLARIIAKEPTPTRVAGRATQLNTSRDRLVVPKVNYTADDIYTTGMRVTWTGEVPASSTAMRVTEPVFGQVGIPVYTAMLSMPLTNDMVEDASFPIVSWSAGKFSETIDILRDNMILNGTGTGQPYGILQNPGDAQGTQPAVVTSGNASAITADGLVKLGFSLPEQYDQNAVFVMNKTNTAQATALLKDANNRYLWGSGLQDSGLSVNLRDRKLLGYDVMLSALMPNIAANAYPAIFGDLSGYYLVNRVGFSIKVLNELYAETNQILLLGRVRYGGLVAEPWKIKVHQIHT